MTVAAQVDVVGPGRRRHVIGWACVALLTLIVAASWAPELFAALGDNHEGRIYARHALQMRNLFELGWSGSGWSTSLAPMASAYSHHPPGFKPFYVVAWLLPGPVEAWLRIIPYGLGVTFLPAVAGLLRSLRVGWAGILVALAATVATPLFWVYGRLWPALGLVALLAWAIADLRGRQSVSRRRLAAVGALAFLTVAANWFSLAAAAALGLWLLAGRGLDRVTAVVGVVMTVAAAGTVAWVLAAPDATPEAEQLLFRTTGGGFTASEFVARIGRWIGELVPVWARLLGGLGMLAGIVDGRVRTVTLGAAALAIGWVGLLPNGSFVHDYWIVPLAIPAVIGTAALFDRVAARTPGAATLAVPLLAAVAAAVAFVAMITGPVPDEYLTGPHQAGELVDDVAPPPAQRTAWHTRGIAGPRWLAWYWDLPIEQIDQDSVGALPPHDVVLVDLRFLPEWLPDRAALVARATALRGDYALVPVAALQ